MTQGRNLRGSCPVFLFMKRPAPNTPKVISNTPNRNKNTPKVFFVTLRVFTILPSHPPVFARKTFVQRGWGTGGIFVIPPVSLPFFRFEPPVNLSRDPKREGNGRDISFPSRLWIPVNSGPASEKGTKGGYFTILVGYCSIRVGYCPIRVPYSY